MDTRIAAAAVALLTALSAAPALAEDVSGNGETKTIDCGGAKVTVSGNDNQVTVTGSCRELTVMGNNNRVTIASVALISVMGNQNKVLWQRAEGQKKPSVNNLGVKNSVKKG